MVELKDFVRDSIVQIVAGARAAADEVAEHGAVVNPRPARVLPDANYYRFKEQGAGESTPYAEIENIEFDVAVTAMKQEGERASVGVVAAVIGAGLSSQSDHSNQTTSRIRFRIPLGLPVGPGKQEFRKRVRAVITE
jgi:hypothetical protein